MKKQIFTFVLTACMLLGFVLTVQAEQRIYLVVDNATIEDPTWRAYGPDDFNRALWLWIDEWSSHGFSLDIEAGLGYGANNGGYLEYTAKSGWMGFNYTLLENATMDFTEITDEWYLYCSFKTNIEQSFSVVLNGANGSEASIAINASNYPLEYRDNYTWYQLEIPVADLVDLGLDYTSPLQGVLAYLMFGFSSVNPDQSKFAVDEVFFTDTKQAMGTGVVGNMEFGRGASGINSLQADIDYTIQGDYIILGEKSRADIYDMQGKKLLIINESGVLSSLEKGIYILKIGEKTAKIIR
ncbi:MAG: T9SS type A sorting domain-containing protein [Candidatus Azobacteroides sp.]|nr:T9SS type A sorting domain-containing protein [Candidatus Azobacteroides sp.]